MVPPEVAGTPAQAARNCAVRRIGKAVATDAMVLAGIRGAFTHWERGFSCSPRDADDICIAGACRLPIPTRHGGCSAVPGLAPCRPHALNRVRGFGLTDLPAAGHPMKPIFHIAERLRRRLLRSTL